MNRFDSTLNTAPGRRIKGVLAVFVLVIVAGAAGWLLQSGGFLLEIMVVAILLAQRSLVDHVSAVADGLRLSLGEGHRAVSMIVSRNTRDMDQSATVRSGIESLSENLSDGVIAPAFWFLVAGLPGILIYKMVNTADSMIGYRSEKYEAFGWAAARFDDLLNWIPARLTSLLIAIIARQTTAWPVIRNDAQRHRSPNAGWPEAAMARALNIALAGPRTYDGVLHDLAWVHPDGRRTLLPRDIDASVRIVWKVWGLCLGLLILFSLLKGF